MKQTSSALPRALRDVGYGVVAEQNLLHNRRIMVIFLTHGTPQIAGMPLFLHGADRAPKLGETTVEIEGQRVPLRPALWCLTLPFNLTGLLAGTVPCGLNSERLPIGLPIGSIRTRTLRQNHAGVGGIPHSPL
jgi:hypothetical protein